MGRRAHRSVLLEHGDVEAFLGEEEGRMEAGRPRAHDDDVEHLFSERLL